MFRLTAPLVLAALLLSACSSTAPGSAAPADPGQPATTSSSEAAPAVVEPLDLTGDWKQANAKSPDNYQAATITASTITINWVADGGETTALYWAGSYVAPVDAAEPYSWNSANDTTQTTSAIAASSDPTKTFTFDGETISYKVSALGVTTTVELERV